MVVTGDSFLGVRFLSAESAGVIGLAALPRLHQPPSGFLTLSAAFAHPSLVALVHATSTHRILVFRAFPSAPAVVPLDTRCSLVVTPACWFRRCDPVPPLGPRLLSSASPTFGKVLPRGPVVLLRCAPNVILTGLPTCVERPTPASGPCVPEGCCAAFSRFVPHPRRVSCNDLERARAPTSELRSGEESVPDNACYRPARPMLS
jgi:hypothetical protein